MSKQQKRLGRGLNALISVDSNRNLSPTPAMPAESESASSSSQEIPISKIKPNPFQPRKDIDPAELESLASSIRASGLIQPIILRQSGKSYELIAGERRWRASEMAGLKSIPAVVRDASDEDMLEIALAENIFREDLNPIERANAYQRYVDEFNLSAEEVAKRLGEDRSTVSNYIRMLDLPEAVKEWVASRKLAMGHARALLGLKAQSEIMQVAKQAINLGLSVRAVEKIVRQRQEAREDAAQPPAEDKKTKRPQIKSLEDAFMRELGTRVEIKESRRKGSGKLTIYYPSLEVFDLITDKLGIKEE